MVVQRVCPHCTTVQQRDADRCDWCEEERPGDGWLEISRTADPWLGVRLEHDLRVVQRLSSTDGLYRIRAEDAGEYFARFVSIDRLKTRRNWIDRARRLGGLIRTRHLSRFVDALERDEYAIIISEYVAGERLRTSLEREGTVDVQTALSIVEQLAIAVEVLHSGGFVHGRLNPGSVVVSRGSHGIRAALCTFGNAMGLSPPVVAPEYLPPRRRGSEASDDVYAVGAILFHMVTGTNPGEAAVDEDVLEMSPSLLRRPSDLNPKLAGIRGLDVLVQDLTAPDHTRIDIAEGVSRIGRLRSVLRSREPADERAEPARAADSYPGPSSTGSGEAVRTTPPGDKRERTDTRRKSVVAYRGEDQRVQLRGSVLKLRNLVGGSRWGPAATVFDLREHGIDGELEAVCAVEGVIWFGTSTGVVGRFDVEAANVESVVRDPDRARVVVVDACEEWVAAGAHSGRVFLIRGDECTTLGGEAPVEYVSVSGRAERLAVGRANGVAELWQVTPEGEAKTQTFDVGSLREMDLSIDGRLLSVSDGKSVSIIDVESGESLGDFGRFDDLIFHPGDVIAHVTSNRGLDD